MQSRGYKSDEDKFDAVYKQWQSERIRITCIKIVEFILLSITVLYLQTIIESDLSIHQNDVNFPYYKKFLNTIYQGIKIYSEFMTA